MMKDLRHVTPRIDCEFIPDEYEIIIGSSREAGIEVLDYAQVVIKGRPLAFGQAASGPVPEIGHGFLTAPNRPGGERLP